MNNSNSAPSLDLDRCRRAWRQVESGAALPAAPLATDLARRELQLAADERAQRRIGRVGLAATLFFGFVVSPTATAAAISMPEQAMNLNYHADRAAVVDRAAQIVTAL